MASRLLACLAAALACGPAGASVLYKSVGPNGTIIFSDRPPGEDARLLEERRLDDGLTIPAPGLEEAFTTIDDDAALARANAEVDLAEHALALARQGTWSPREGLRIDNRRWTEADQERVEFYQRNLQKARRALLARLRERQLAAR